MAQADINGPRISPTRQDTFIVHMKCAGVRTGVWDKKTGGDADSDELKYFPGGMVPAISLGGKKQPANIVLQRNYDKVQDHDNIGWLLDHVGRGLCHIHQRPLGLDGNPYGKNSVIWVGTLKRVTVPDVDSEGNAAAMLEVEITVAANPSAG
jgi:hypothetical protein